MNSKITEERVYPSSVMLGGEPIARGLSLRDHFATTALSEILREQCDGRCDAAARLAYQYADAMVKAR